MGKHLPSRENIAKEDLVDILRLDTSTLNGSYIVELVYRSFIFTFSRCGLFVPLMAWDPS